MNKQELIEQNMNLVYYVINTFYPYAKFDEDIIQWGMIGLCKAANKWDESRGKFSTIACLYIRSEIHDAYERLGKHNGVLSLDYEYDDDTFLSNLIADRNDMLTVNFDSFVTVLTDEEREIVKYRLNGLDIKEIAKQRGEKVERTRRFLRKIRKKWEQLYED